MAHSQSPAPGRKVNVPWSIFAAVFLAQPWPHLLENQKIPSYLVLDNNGWLLFVLSTVLGVMLEVTKRSKEPALRTYSHMPKKRKTNNFEHEIVKILKSNVHQPIVVQSYDPNEMFLQLQLPLI